MHACILRGVFFQTPFQGREVYMGKMGMALHRDGAPGIETSGVYFWAMKEREEM